MGPTASGKTDLAAGLADQADVELVSVDAAQVYREMNIGTAKPNQAFLKSWPHHLVDIRDPMDTYSAAQFVTDATRLIHDIHQRGRLPVLVGGTMFYYKALEHGLSELPSADAKTRAALERQWYDQGPLNMHRTLQKIDPEIASRIRPSDTQRLLRALEIHHLTGVAPSVAMMRSKARGLGLPLVKIALSSGHRRALHERILLRFERMLEDGLVDEVKQLLVRYEGLREQPSMRIVGYRQTIDYLDGKYSEGEMLDASVAATRQLAKRQLTWLRQQSNVVW